MGNQLYPQRYILFMSSYFPRIFISFWIVFSRSSDDRLSSRNHMQITTSRRRRNSWGFFGVLQMWNPSRIFLAFHWLELCLVIMPQPTNCHGKGSYQLVITNQESGLESISGYKLTYQWLASIFKTLLKYSCLSL